VTGTAWGTRNVLPPLGQEGVKTRRVSIAEALALAGSPLPVVSMPRSVARWFARMDGRLALLAMRRRAEIEGVQAPSWTTVFA